jgi:hypothetical protein
MAPRLPRAVPWLSSLARVGLVAAPVALLTGELAVFALLVLCYVCSRGIDMYFDEVGPAEIVYLRAFRDRLASGNYYNRLETIIECFGRPLAAAAEATIPLYRLDRISNLLTRRRNMLGALKLSEADWRKDIRELLADARLVVIDLSTPTENVLWELQASLELVGKDRVLLLQPDSEFPLAPDVPDVEWLSHGSKTLEQDFALWLERHLGPPGWIKRQELKAFLKHGRCAQVLAWALAYVLVELFRRGLSRSTNRK